MNSTLANGLSLLMVLAGRPRAHSVSELARELDLPKSHVHRLLQTLVENQYVEKDAQRQYAIGIGALRLGHALLKDIPIRQRALPHMRTMAQETGFSLTLALPLGMQAITVAHVSHDGEIRSTDETLGTVLDPVTSACGKLFLAHLSEEDLELQLCLVEFPKRGPNAHRNVESLLRDLQTIRTLGYSINDREASEEGCSLAIPFYGKDGELKGALGTSGFSEPWLLADGPQPILARLENLKQRIETPEKEPAL